LEPLVAKLGEALASPLADPLAAELVVVPSADMKTYLKRELARVLGATGGDDGIVSNFNFIYPRQLINATVENVVGARTSPWDANNLTWEIIDTLLSNTGLQVPGFEKAPIAVARRAADLFDRYASHRPEMLNHWSQGGVDDGTESEGQPNAITRDQRWQADLFRELSRSFAADGVPQRAISDLGGFAKSVSGAVGSGQSDRVSVFGLSGLSRAARQILEVLAEHWDISIYMVYPAGAVWPVGNSVGPQLRADAGVSPVKHPLTARWGAQVVESAALFGDVPRTFVSFDAEGSSLLRDLQVGISSDVDDGAVVLGAGEHASVRGAGDGSLQIHACYGLGRQVEALRDAILHELNTKPDLRLRDIAILCADVEKAAPILNAVFAPHREAGVSLPSLPINVLDGGASTQDPVVEAFMAVLHLLSSRCTPTDVLDVAHLDPVRRRFGFDDDAIALISTWAEDLAVRYGVSAELRAAQWGLPESISAGTWDSALNRLMMGIAIPGEIDRLGPGDVVPYDGIGGSELYVAGLVSEFIARVASFVELVNVSSGLTVESWCSTVRGMIDAFIDVPPGDTARLVRLKGAISSFEADAGRAFEHGDAKFSVHELTEMLSAYFADERGLYGNRYESITVAPLAGLQHIPYRMLAILGADESAFSGAHSDGDDILTNHPCVGEPIYSLNGRQHLLNAVMSARDTLIITCTGADISNNKELPLAVPVQELLEFVDGYLHKKAFAGEPYGSQQVFVRHPRQNFDGRTLSPGLVFADRPFTFDPQAKEAHEVLLASADGLKGVGEGGVGSGAARSVAPPTLRNLVEVITRPADFFMNTVLDVRIPQMPASSSTDDKNLSGEGVVALTIDNLTWAKEGRGLLDRIVASGDAADDAIRLWESVRPYTDALPPGQLGDLVVREIRDELRAMISLLPPSLQTLSAGVDVDGSVTVDGGATSMRIQNVHDEAFARVRYRRFTESMVLEPWVELARRLVLRPSTGTLRWRVHHARSSLRPRRWCWRVWRGCTARHAAMFRRTSSGLRLFWRLMVNARPRTLSTPTCSTRRPVPTSSAMRILRWCSASVQLLLTTSIWA
jgi:exodeoxyribonuclease V gamma subunit